MKVFWSWQSDVSPQSCRTLIRDALVAAIERVGLELNVEDAERPEIDQDTKDEPGMVDIPNTILEKISEAAVFVADLTPFTELRAEKHLPIQTFASNSVGRCTYLASRI